ncbi:hypothetical protein BC936DRAFT_138338, partial [Jimgerdemannia flammicorona]
PCLYNRAPCFFAYSSGFFKTVFPLQPCALLFHVHILRLQDCLASITPLKPRLASSTVYLASSTAHLATSRPSCLVNCVLPLQPRARPHQDHLASSRTSCLLKTVFPPSSQPLLPPNEASSSYFEDRHPSEWSYLGFLEALKFIWMSRDRATSISENSALRKRYCNGLKSIIAEEPTKTPEGIERVRVANLLLQKITVKRKTEIDALIVLGAARTKEASSLTDFFEIEHKQKKIHYDDSTCMWMQGPSKQNTSTGKTSVEPFSDLDSTAELENPFLESRNCFVGENHRLSEIDDLYKHAVAQGAHEDPIWWRIVDVTKDSKLSLSHGIVKEIKDDLQNLLNQFKISEPASTLFEVLFALPDENLQKAIEKYKVIGRKESSMSSVGPP